MKKFQDPSLMEVLSIENPILRNYVQLEVDKVKSGASNESKQNQNITNFIKELCIEEVGTEIAVLEEQFSTLQTQLKNETNILHQKQEGLKKVDMHTEDTKVLNDARPLILYEKFVLFCYASLGLLVGYLNYLTIYNMLIILEGKASVSMALICTILSSSGLDLLYYKGLRTNRARSQFKFICNIILIVSLITFLITFCYQYLVPIDNSIFQGGLDESVKSDNSDMNNYIDFILLLSRLCLEYTVQFYCVSGVVDTISTAGATKKVTIVKSDSYESFSQIVEAQKSEVEKISLKLSESKSSLERMKSKQRQLIRDSILLANRMHSQTLPSTGE